MSAIRGAGSERSDMYEVFRDEQLSVVSDRPVPRAEARALAARIEKAWRSDLREHRWDDPRTLREPLTVAVLSPGAFADFTGDATGSIAGVTTGKDNIVLPARVLSGATPGDLNRFVLGRIRPGAIVLLHNAFTITINAVPALVQALRARGYTLVTMTELVQRTHRSGVPSPAPSPRPTPAATARAPR